jgi:hypothetical protein
VRAKYWPMLGLSDGRKSNSLSSIASKDNTSPSITGTRSSESGGSRTKKISGDEAADDVSPINYADIEGFSDYFSSPHNDESNVGESCKLINIS